VRLSPADWRFHRFPLSEEGGEEIEIEEVVRLGLEALDQAARTGDRTPMGPIPHWAHLLVCEQGETGDWPKRINVRTGEAVGKERTKGPARLLSRLGAFLGSSEFDQAVQFAKISSDDS
jgi:hypothetical protein